MFVKEARPLVTKERSRVSEVLHLEPRYCANPHGMIVLDHDSHKLKLSPQTSARDRSLGPNLGTGNHLCLLKTLFLTAARSCSMTVSQQYAWTFRCVSPYSQ